MTPPTVDLVVRQEPDKVHHTIRKTISLGFLALMCAGSVPLCGVQARAASSATGPAGTPSTVGQLGRKDALEFEGNQTFPTEAIHRGFRLHLGYHLAAHPTAPLGAYLTTLQSMVTEGYRRGGFSNPQVNVTLSPDQNRILVRIQEGHRFKAGVVRFKGALPMADPSVQEKLLNALAGLSFASPTNGMPTTNLLRATWTKGAYVPFDEQAVDELKASVVQELGTLNFYRPDLKLTIVPDIARKEADLVVDMLDEGLKGTIEDFSFAYPLREKKNADEELLDFLGLKRGMPFQGSLLQDLTERLWDSGRFFRHEVTLEPLADVGKFKLSFKLEDLMNASPLRVPLTTNEMVMLKLCRRLNELDRGTDDLVLTGAVDLPESSGLGSFLAELVLSRSGLALLVRAPVSNAPPRVLYATVLSERLGMYSGWRRQMLLFPDKTSIKAFASLLPEPEPGIKERFTLSLGAGFSSVTSDKAVDWTFRFAPSRFLAFAHDDEERFKVEDGVLSARLDPETGLPFDVNIDVETGRLLQASLVAKTNAASVNLQLRFEEGGYARVSAEITKATVGFQNQHQSEFPLSSLLGFCATDLLESGVLESPFLIEKFFEGKPPEERLAWEKGLPNLRSTVAKVKAALGKKDLAE